MYFLSTPPLNIFLKETLHRFMFFQNLKSRKKKKSYVPGQVVGPALLCFPRRGVPQTVINISINIYLHKYNISYNRLRRMYRGELSQNASTLDGFQEEGTRISALP